VPNIAYRINFTAFGPLQQLTQKGQKGITAPKNTLYYEKYKKIDLSLFLCCTQQRSTVQKLSCPRFIHIFLSSKNNKYKQI
jgi:hypothetical protein